MGIHLPEFKLGVDYAKSYPGIQVVPILMKPTKAMGEPRFLWEGIADSSIEIKEKQNYSVPTVTVVNHTQENFLGYKGGIIRGGGQNRQILHSFVLPEKATLDIPVQCVQHGRWNPHRQQEFSSKKGDVTSSSLRFSKKSQSEAWQTIRDTSMLTGTGSCTEDYTVVCDSIIGSHEEMAKATSSISMTDNQSEQKRQQSRGRAQQILEDLEKSLADQVGIYITMVDPFEWKSGKVRLLRAVEIFASPGLYQKVHRDVLSSFAMDAALLPQDEVSAHFYEEKMPKGVEEEKFAALLQQIPVTSWQENGNIGVEKRYEVESPEVFGETISVKDEMLHLMYAAYQNV